MFSSLKSSKQKSSIAERAVHDEVTKQRLKYKPYYHHFEKQVGTHVWLEGREMILLSSNDYLGFNQNPTVIEAGKKGLVTWGSSSTGSRIANGSRGYHHRLEKKLADFLGKEDCHVSAAGYLSCMSAIQAFVQRGDAIFADKNIHSCLWAGIASTMGRVEKFSHNNPADFENVLSYEDPKTPKMLVFEGVYSMEGHLAHAQELLQIASENNCFSVMDDAHGFGVLGEQGRGTANHLDLTDEIDIICGSLSKAMASTGGFVAGDKALIEHLRSHSKQTIFSAAISPSQAYCAEAAIDLLQTEPEHLERLWSNTRRYNAILNDLGLDTWGSETPAIPVVIGDKLKAYRFWQELMKEGIFTTVSLPPAVPPKKDLIRTAISAAHTDEDIDRIAEAFAKVTKRVL
ncbi:MAG: pyridoxal phosphate-dependent aminotransferase family protein [Verrucomicrobiota bacterium]